MKTIRNSSHFTEEKKYFEWWYFHFVSQDFTINMVLHETDVFGLTKSPYISLTLLRKGNEPKYYKHYLQPESILRSGDFLNTKDQEFRESNKKIKFNLNFDGCRFQGSIEKNFPKTLIEQGVLYENSEGFSMWLVEVPFGLFNATLNIDDEKFEVKGVSYQDHQWGSLRIQDFVDKWIWGHLSNDRMSIVFFHILTQGGEVVNRVILKEANSIKTSVFLSTDSLVFFKENAEFYKNNYEVSIFIPNFELELHSMIQPSDLMRSRIAEDYLKFDATYLRWASEAKVLVQGKIEKLTGLTEYLNINRK